MIQNPVTAAFPGMPQSLAAPSVDIVADLPRIGPILADLLSDVEVPSRPEDETALHAFLEEVRAHTGIDFRAYKQHKIYRRVGPRHPQPLLPNGRVAAFTAPVAQPVERRRTAGELFEVREALRQSRTSQDVLLLNLPVGVIVVDARYDIQAINHAARRLLAIHSSAIGEDFVHLAQQVAHRALRTIIDGAIQDGAAGSLEEVEVPDAITGNPTYLRIDCYPQSNADQDAPVTALILVTDISAMVQARRDFEAMRAREATSAAALARTVADLEQANADLVRRNTELQQSNAALEAARAAAETVAGEHARQVERLAESNRALLNGNLELARADAELRARFDVAQASTEEAQAAIEEAETLTEEMQATNEALETLNEEFQATIEELNTSNADLLARGEELQGLASSLEAQHRQSERERARLAAILDGLADGVLVVTPEGAPIVTNAAYTALFDQPTLELIEAGDRPLPASATPQARAARGETFRMTFTLRTAGGQQRWCEAIGQPVRGDDDQQWGVVVIRDVTEGSLRRLQEQFVALTNHELRTPIGTIQGYLELVRSWLRQRPETERPLRHATAALAEVHRLVHLVDDLRDVTRLEGGSFRVELEPLRLDTLVRETVEAARLVTQKQTIVYTGDEAITVNGDAGRLRQVVLNLITNAITHAAGTDRVDVRLRRVACEQGAVAEVAVQDYGAGIAAEHLPDLFSRFYQVSHAYEGQGLGLGLYICRQIVTAHDGTITVASTVGAGTTFTVQLPLAEPEGAHP